MIDNLMPDIPRIYTAAAEWIACLIFIFPLKKRFEWWKSAFIIVGMLIVQSAFLVSTGNVLIYFWIPCMIIAVFLMIGFIHLCCDDAPYCRAAERSEGCESCEKGSVPGVRSRR